MLYVLALNVSSDIGARCDSAAIRRRFSDSITATGVAPAAVNVSKQSVPGLFSDRYTVAVSCLLGGDSLTPSQTSALDTAAMRAVRDTCGAQWSITHMLRGLPPQGSGHFFPMLWGDVTDVSRLVDYQAQSSRVTVTHPTATTRVEETTDASIQPGETLPSGLRNAGNEAAKALSDYKVPLAIGGAIVLVGVGGFVAWRFK